MEDQSVFGEPIDVTPLFRPERAALIAVLRGLTEDQWLRATPCPGWSVHDVSLHLLGDDLRRLSAGRDRHTPSFLGPVASLDEQVPLLDEQNQSWVRGTRILSPRLTIELLEWSAEPTERYLAGLPPDETGWSVSWVAPDPAPNWMDVAREFTERWVHQQQIRDAVGEPGLTEKRFLDAVIETFLRALPMALPTEGYGGGAEVQVHVGNPVGRAWAARFDRGRWRLASPSPRPDASVSIDPDALWRRAVRMIDPEQAAARADLTGDEGLAHAVLDIRSAIVAA